MLAGDLVYDGDSVGPVLGLLVIIGDDVKKAWHRALRVDRLIIRLEMLPSDKICWSTADDHVFK